MSIFDEIIKRLKVVIKHDLYSKLSSKILIVKHKLTQNNIERLDEAKLLWMSLRLFDAISLNIYDE